MSHKIYNNIVVNYNKLELSCFNLLKSIITEKKIEINYLKQINDEIKRKILPFF